MEPEARSSWSQTQGSLRDRIQEYERWIRTLDYQVRTLEKERQKLSAIVNHTDAGFLAVDRSLQVVWANQIFIERFAAASPQTPLLGTPCNRVLCGRESICAECPAFKPFKSGITAREFLFQPSGAVSHLEMNLQLAGQARQVYATAVPIRSLEGAVEQVILMLQDITDLEVLRRSRKALQRSESQLRAVLETVGEGIITVDSAGTVVMVNQEVQNIWGYRPEELIGHNLQRLMPERYRQAHAASLKRYLKTGVAHVLGKRVELEGLRKDGSVFPLEVHVKETRTDGRLFFTAAVRDLTDRKRAEGALRVSEERFRQIAETIKEVFWLSNSAENEMIYISPGYEEIWGRSCESLCQNPLSWVEAIHLEDRQRVLEAAMTKQLKGQFDEEYRIVRPDGSIRWIRHRAFPIRDEKGEVHRIAGTAEDITKEKQLADQLRQVQKMEAVGQLAGGIAHDFNNLLTIIIAYSDFLLERAGNDEQLRKETEGIRKAAERAAGLTRQLLAFSRQQVLQPKVLDLNEVVTDMEKMLRRLVGENIELSAGVQKGLWRVKADPGQLEQVIMNLVVNARDAMPAGGKLIIRTNNAELDEKFAREHIGSKAGQYVALSVTDTGCGMDSEVQKRIFEPFFTTKEKGRGTGLGLSTVYGIVKQSGGYISVESRLSYGTTFKIYLPKVEQSAEETETDKVHPKTSRGTETVLLAEDEDDVRLLASEILLEKGYVVLEARNGQEAISICERHTGPIHLLISDMVMPKMGGPEAAPRLTSLRPEMKMLFVSGYTDSPAVLEKILAREVAFLQKPFTPYSLARKVREVLDAGKKRKAAARK